MKTTQFFFDHSNDLFTTPNLVAFYVLDRGLNVRFWSKTTEEITGIEKEEAIGKNIVEISIPKIAKRTPLFQESFEKEKQISYVETTDDNTWFSTSIIPEKDYLFVLTRDITEYKNSERELTNLQHIKRNLLNSLKDSIWAIDTNYRLLFANETYFQRMAKSTGKNIALGEQILQEPLTDDADDRRRKMWKSAYDKALKGNSNRIVLSYLIDGEKKYFQADLNPISSHAQGEDEVFGVACFSRDITERRRHLLSIKEQNESLKKIAWMNSHKVRAPLANILGLADLITNHDNSLEEIKKLCGHLLDHATKLDDVIKEVSQKTNLKK